MGWLTGSDKPEKEEVHIGFMPLTDCAPLVMASVLELDKKYGLRFVLRREASWAGVRDKLASGALDAAHALYGMIYGVQLGIGSAPRDMAVLMGLNRNGQTITLSKALAERGAVDGPSLARLMQSDERRYTFAQTFPTGTHAMWLYYWLAAHGIHPLRDARTISVPPPQMVANMRAGEMDGFCAGDPWGRRAMLDGVGGVSIPTQEIWPDHPEKVLGCSLSFVQEHPNTCRAMVAAILEACRWLDTNREQMADVLAAEAYVNTSKEAIGGCGIAFHDDGEANFPYLSDGMWFMTQHRRWGLLKEDPDYLSVAKAVNQICIYQDAATMTGTPLPHSVMRSSTLLGGAVWDGENPQAFAAAPAMCTDSVQSCTAT